MLPVPGQGWALLGAFCADRSLCRPLFCFKNQASHPSVAAERLHKSHLMALGPSVLIQLFQTWEEFLKGKIFSCALNPSFPSL